MNYPYPLVEIVWDDACNDSGWQSTKEIKLVPQVVTTVAFLIAENKKYVLVGHTFTEPNQYLGWFQIPKGMIISRKTLKRATKGKNASRL